MPDVLNGWSRSTTGKVASSITIELKRAGKLHIEKKSEGLLKLSYLECSRESKPRGTEVIRSRALKDALPFFNFLGMVIPTRLGNLTINDPKEINQLRNWLSDSPK